MSKIFEIPTNRELLNLGFNEHPSEKHVQALIKTFVANDDGNYFEDPRLVGAVCGAVLLHPDSDFWADDEKAREIVERISKVIASAADFNTPEWTGFYFGRFGVCGDMRDLDEIIRRARHQDGSTASVQTASHAIGILSESAKEDKGMLAKLLARGFNPGNVKSGSFQPASAILPQPLVQVSPVMPALVDPAANVPIDPGNPNVYPIPADSSLSFEFKGQANPNPLASGLYGTPKTNPVAGAGVTCEADAKNGVVLVFLSESGKDLLDPTRARYQANLSITDALTLENHLVTATRSLLVPADGYAWNDSADFGCGSRLIDSKGNVVAEVEQDEASAQFACYLVDELPTGSHPGKREQLGYDKTYPDFNVAKFALADYFRRERQSALISGKNK